MNADNGLFSRESCCSEPLPSQRFLVVRHGQRGDELLTTLDPERVEQCQPVRDLVLVLRPARQHIGQQVGTAAKIVSYAAPRAGEVSHNIASNVTPGIERDIKLAFREKPRKYTLRFLGLAVTPLLTLGLL